jgi:hypothetical protein
VEVPEIDEQAGALSQDEGKRVDRDGVDEEDQPSADAEVPEGERDDRLLPPLGCDPLHEEARREEELPEEPDDRPGVQPEVAVQEISQCVHRGGSSGMDGPLSRIL